MKVVTAVESIAAVRAKGLDRLGGMSEESTETYFLMKWGINRSAGIIKNAGKVIRLKIPKTTTKARIADANADDRCCKDCQLVFHSHRGFLPYFLQSYESKQDSKPQPVSLSSSKRYGSGMSK